MRTLMKITEDKWLDLSLIVGVTKVQKGYRLNLGANGSQFPQVMTRKQILKLLKIANIAIGDF